MNIKNLFWKGNNNKIESKSDIAFESLNLSKRVINSGDTSEYIKNWVHWGNGDNFPNEMFHLVDQSPIHSAIIHSKSNLAMGTGFNFINGETILTKELIASPNPEQTLIDVVYDLSRSWQITGEMGVEVFTNNQGRITSFRAVTPEQFRPEAPDEFGIVHNFYVGDFNKKSSLEIIPAYKAGSPGRSFLWTRKSAGDGSVHGRPAYIAAVKYIEMEPLIATYHHTNLLKGFTPGLIVQLFEKTKSPEEKIQIRESFKKAYGGIDNTSSLIMTFSEGKEFAPEIRQLETSDIPEQLIGLQDMVTQHIITAHRIPSPSLLGIATPGRLGLVTEMETAWKIYESTVTGPDRRLLQNFISEISKGWGAGPIEIIPFELNFNV